MTRSRPAPKWIVINTHCDYPGTTLDLSEFAYGAPDQKTGQGAYNWNGGFRGRPGLLEDLMPVIRAKLSGANPHNYATNVSQLRVLFRFLDAYENMLGRSGAKYQPVERLHHLTGAHLDMMTKPAPGGEWEAAGPFYVSPLRTLILDAVYFHDLPQLNLAALSRRRGLPRDVPTADVGASLIRFLRGEVLAVFARWRRADHLAANGRNLLDFPSLRGRREDPDFQMSEADAHATYRAVAAATGYPLPTVQMVRGALGLAPGTKLPSWWPHYVDPSSLQEGRLVGELISLRALAAGLYPTTQDLMKCALLCLGRSAWNPGTLSSLDIANWCSRYDERAIWVFSRKWRSGGAYQYTVSNERERTSVYGIICKLIERTKALRSWLKKNRDAHPTPDIALRSPWLGMSDRVNLLLMTVDPGNSAIINRHLKSAIAKHNQSPDSKALVGDMNCTDFRDIAAAWTYRHSRYSMWITMVLLGHKHLSTTRIYVATRASRQESHATVSSVIDDVFQQISESHRWDPTLTRAAVEGMDLSADAIARLNSYRDQRTYDGSVCSDPFHPPRRIDPSHPGDGKTRCIQGHRCAAACCPNGHVFKESLPWLARRTAELEWLEQELGAVRFSTSTEKEDLSELQRTLSQWPEAEVQRELQHWREKLADGSHRPLRFAGRR